MNKPDDNVAFKCTYNDGGAESGFVGFGGTCTNGNIFRNVKNKRRWCSEKGNKCRAFYENDFLGQRPRAPCYESRIVDEWRFSPGMYHTDERNGDPIPMNGARTGKVALLTTRHHRCDTEAERIVFAVYEIIDVHRDEDGLVWLQSDADHSIRLSEPVAFALPYWRFKSLPASGKPDWRTGLFRYVPNQEVANYLYALGPLLQNAEDRFILDRLLDCCGNPEPTGYESMEVIE